MTVVVERIKRSLVAGGPEIDMTLCSSSGQILGWLPETPAVLW